MANNGDVQFRAVADRMQKEIQDLLGESDNVWKIISAKQTVIHELYAEQIKTSDKFSQYFELWKGRSYTDSENIASFHRFTEIDEEVGSLEAQLDGFEEKLQRSGKMVRDLMRDIRVHFGKLRSGLERILAAQSIADLEQVEMQSLEWLKTVPDPEVEMLSDEWERLELNLKITNCLHQLQQLLQSNDDELQGDIIS